MAGAHVPGEVNTTTDDGYPRCLALGTWDTTDLNRLFTAQPLGRKPGAPSLRVHGEAWDTTNLIPPRRQLLPSQNIQLFKPHIYLFHPLLMPCKPRLFASQKLLKTIQIFCS